MIQIKGIEELQDALTKATKSLTEEVKSAVAGTANAITESARQNCSGKLADSITVVISDDGMSATVSTNEPYAAFVEYGAEIPSIKAENAKVLHWVEDGKDVFVKSARAHENKPKPFLNPAAEANRQSFIDEIKDIISN
ncbi:MAG: HK97 gp10 family phage protein [Bacteroidia bacterium]